jgi:hypothetical protein
VRRFAAVSLLLPVLAFGQANLNFQNGREGEVPPGWFVLDAAKVPGFSASWQRDGCRASLPCALLSAPATAASESSGTLMESFAALPFHGQTVRLRAWIRLEKKTPSDRAQMLLHVGRAGFQAGFSDNMADRPIVTEEWSQYEIRGEVVSDAETIQIGLTLHGAGRVWIGEVEFGAVTAETAGMQVDAARDAIQKQYGRMDAAFTRGDAAEIEAVLMPGAQMGVGTIREPLLPAIKGEISRSPKLTAKTEVSSVRLDGDEAVVMVRREARANSSRSVVTSHRDTWIQTSNGWRWRESIEVSYHWVLPPTTAETASPVVAELKTNAVPIAGSDDLAAFGSAVGDARLVALGEGAHGTREFSEWKQRLVEYLVTRKGFMLLAGVKDADVQALADRLHIDFVPLDAVSADNITHLPKLSIADSKVVLWTDNAHARDPQLREKFGRKLYVVGFGFDRGEVRAVGVEKGESKGLGLYPAPASPSGSGDAILSAAEIPQFFLNLTKLPVGSALSRWLSEMHLFHDMGAFWVLDDPDASLQPEELGLCYDGLFYVEEVHAGG